MGDRRTTPEIVQFCVDSRQVSWAELLSRIEHQSIPLKIKSRKYLTRKGNPASKSVSETSNLKSTPREPAGSGETAFE